jgi:hypothetical protein
LTQHVTCSLNSSVQTAYIATYSVLYAYSTLYAAQNNVLSIPGPDITIAKEEAKAEHQLQPASDDAHAPNTGWALYSQMSRL